MFEGVGTSLGNLISGIMFGKLGGAMTFRIFGVAALIGCLINVALTFSKVFQNYNNEGIAALKAEGDNNPTHTVVDDTQIEST